MNPTLMFSRLSSPSGVERRASAVDTRCRLERPPKLRMNPALTFFQDLSAFDHHFLIPPSPLPSAPSESTPWAILRMNPALVFARRCSVAITSPHARVRN
jgi:hypothetical protein